VLYSKKFRPLNRIISKEYKNPPDGWIMNTTTLKTIFLISVLGLCILYS
jgi:hypothetical protein